LNDIEYTFKPNQIKQSLDEHKYSNNSLSFDIQNNSLGDTLEIDKYKPSDSRKKFYDCQPLIQDLKKDYADDNEEFDQLLNESIGNKFEKEIANVNRDLITDNDNDTHNFCKKSSHR
jgi:mannose-6-phosphate isomerase class I